MIVRNTRQREEILDVIRGVNCHMTAEEVHEKLQQNKKSVGIATVYRNLNRLAEENEITKIVEENRCYYDGNANPHYHLRCVKCGKLQDASLEYQEQLDQLIQVKKGFKILGHQLTFDCICDDCLSMSK